LWAVGRAGRWRRVWPAPAAHPAAPRVTAQVFCPARPTRPGMAGGGGNVQGGAAEA